MGAREKLDEYTQAMRDLAVFDAIHRDVVKARARLVKRADDIAKEIKADVHRTCEEPENRHYKVVVTPRTSRYYDADELLKVYPEVSGLKGVITKQADRELVDHYRKVGVIPEEVAGECEHSEILTPSVSIKAKCGFGRPTKEQKESIKIKAKREKN